MSCGAPLSPQALFTGTGEDAAFYSVVRSTIHGLDQLRIHVVVASLTLMLGLLTAGGASWIQLAGKRILHDYVPPGAVAGLAFSVFSLLVGLVFIFKLALFNSFLPKAVEIAKDVEQHTISMEGHRMTQAFDEHRLAGRGGQAVFNFAPLGMAFFAFCSTCFFVWRIYEEWGPPPS